MLPLLRHRFPDTRPALAMGILAQKEGPVDLIIARDYRRHWPVPISSSCFDADKLFLMKTTFHPGQLLYGRADPDAVGDQDEGGQEEAHPGKGGVSRIFNIVVQATPGGDAGGGLAGEAAE